MHDDLVLFSDRLNQLRKDPEAPAFITKGRFQLLFSYRYEGQPEQPTAIEITLSTLTKNLFSIQCPLSISPRALLSSFLNKVEEFPQVRAFWEMPEGDS